MLKCWVRLVIACVFAGGVMMPSEAAAKSEPPETVQTVDVNRYMGLWYEIARYPVWFEKDCVAVTAEYTLLPNGKVRVLNSCRKKSFDGPGKIAKGKAWIADKKTNAKLKVSFFWPFRGDYWILELGPDYEYAIVGDPKRKTLWILARAPRISEELYAALLKKIEAMGFDPLKLEKTPQPR